MHPIPQLEFNVTSDEFDNLWKWRDVGIHFEQLIYLNYKKKQTVFNHGKHNRICVLYEPSVYFTDNVKLPPPFDTQRSLPIDYFTSANLVQTDYVSGFALSPHPKYNWRYRPH